MNDYKLLLGLTLRNRLAMLRVGSMRKDNGKIDIGKIAASIVALASVAFLAGLLIFAEIKLFNVLKLFRQESLLVGLAIMLSILSTLLMSFFHVLSCLYFGKDTVWMSYLPVRSSSVMAAKMTEVWLGEIFFATAFVAPVSILYGLHIHADVVFWLRMVIIVLCMPVLPLVIIAFFTTLLARLSALAKHKEAIAMAFSMVLVVLIVSVESTLLPKIPDDADAMFFVRILLDNEGIVNLLTNAIPPVRWALHGLQGNWAELMLLVAVCVAAVVLMLVLLGRNYLAICHGQAEHASRRRKVKTDDRTWRQRSVIAALFRKEWAAVIKSPVIAFNSLPGIIMFPLMFCVAGAGIASTMDISLLLSELKELIAQISKLDLALIIAAAVSMSCFINPAVATAVSREGAGFGISKMLPATPRQQLTAKLLVGLMIDVLAVGIAAAMVAFIFPEEVPAVLLACVISLLLSFAVSSLNLTLDAVRPNFHWTNETQVIKQSANVLFGMLVGMLMFALPIVGSVLAFGWGSVGRFAVAGGIVVLEAALGYFALRFCAEKRFAALEDVD